MSAALQARPWFTKEMVGLAFGVLDARERHRPMSS